MNSLFFSKVYPRFSKLDIYKCPFFKKGLRELKFSYIITLSASALPILRGYLYDLIVCQMVGHVATIMVRIENMDISGVFMEDIQNIPFLWKYIFRQITLQNLGHILQKWPQTIVTHFSKLV